MKGILILAALLTSGWSSPIPENLNPLSDEYIEAINNLGTTWKGVEIPESYDVREAWSQCKSVHLIRDQGPCGSCWAHGAAEAMSDRICIASEGKNVYQVPQDEEQIQLEILKHGSISVALDVYSDLLSYKSGVYQHHSGHLLAAHAVKMLGWGVENGVKYWLLANSWNPTWGEKGYIKILRGKNECGIEEEGFAGEPDLSRGLYNSRL
ncbi:CTSB [Cordylochernes scorpioides]|uniref:CTSB n=1 Tax=Cordylochernes scorpioides TaxID=51811 RepID=A0ABY6K9C1_9ARAC|nr:CTSB [Cordylochernes scorpioides]